MADTTHWHYSVPEVSCGHCKAAIEREVADVAGVTAVNVDVDAKTVDITGGDEEAVRAAIVEAGYDIAEA